LWSGAAIASKPTPPGWRAPLPRSTAWAPGGTLAHRGLARSLAAVAAGLAGEPIVPEARILAIADVVGAVASHRSYRPSRGLPAALDEIRSGAGTLYDAAVAGACLAVFEQRGFVFTT
jgi:hypothetical protein